jgi:hypothetical protein
MTHRTEVVENDNMSVIGIGRLVALALLASATLGPALAQQQQKPNILVIMADDIGPAVPQLSEQARRPHREAQEDPSKSNVTLNATKMTANTRAASHRTRR